MRVLVCGGRDYRNVKAVWDALDQVHKTKPIDVIIHGGATGADRHAKAWAANNDIPELEFIPQWDSWGKSAGPIRNRQMLMEGRPDLVLALPGGKGTASMVKLAMEEGVMVMKYDR